jgi:hypothetical protein
MTITAGQFMTDRHDLLTFTMATPAQGVRGVWTIPAGLAVQIVSVFVDLQTSVNLTDRALYCFIEDTVPVQVHFSYAGKLQPISKTWAYVFGLGLPFIDLTTGFNRTQNALCCCTQLKAGDKFVIDWNGKDALDQLGGARVRYFAWKDA